MSVAKKLNLSFEECCDIARALNENLIANKTRAKEDKIKNDYLIREKFNISRKDFNLTAKDYGIQFNFAGCLYEIPESALHDTNATEVNHGSDKVNQVNTESIPDIPGIQNMYGTPSTPYILEYKVGCIQNLSCTQNEPVVSKDIEEGIPSNYQGLPISLYEISEQFNKVTSNEILSLTDEVKEMLSWYREHKNKKVVEDTEVNLNNDKLNGAVVTRSYKVYQTVAEEFSKFAADRKESIKDLISLALVEFVEKYKK